MDDEIKDESSLICPKCGKEIDGYVRTGKQMYVRCPDGCRIGLSKLSKEEYDMYVEEISANKGDHDNNDRRDRDYDDRMDRKDDGIMPRIPSDAEIITNTLNTFGITPQKQRIILDTLDKNGSMDPLELQNLLIGLKAASRETAQFVVSNYQVALDKRESDRIDLITALGGVNQDDDDPTNEETDLDKMVKFMKIMREMRQMDVPQQQNNPEIEELKRQNEELKKQNEDRRFELLQNQMKSQNDLLLQKIDESSGFKQDVYKLGSVALQEHYSALKQGKTSPFGDGERLEKGAGALWRAKDHSGMKHPSEKGNIEQTEVNAGVVDLIDDEYVERYDQARTEDMINRNRDAADEDGDDNE